MAIINAALEDAGIDMTIGNESGASVATKLNGVFGDELITSSLSGSEFAQAVEDGFDGLEPAPAGHDIIRLLHVSDTHGYTESLAQAKTMMQSDSDIKHLIISGDLTSYSTKTYTNDTLSALESIKAMGGDRILLVKGNHDAIDNAHSNLANVSDIENYSASSGALINIKKFEKAMMGHSVNNVFTPHVTFADPSASVPACYWHKDVVVGTHTLRIIAIDDYETASKFDGTYYVSYNQAQATWLLNLLYNTPSDYHILMITHEPPCKDESSHDEPKSMRPNDNDTADERAQKLFVSELHYYWHERPGEVDDWLPLVMKAYLHKENLDTTWANKNTNFPTLTLQKDFSQHEPGTLVGWMFGHIHNDVIGYMPYPAKGYDDQLLIGICAGDSRVPWASFDDLLCDFTGSQGQGVKWATSEPTYRINEITIDFTDGTINIKRHGNKTTAPNSKSDGTGTVRPYGGRVRDEVTFQL